MNTITTVLLLATLLTVAALALLHWSFSAKRLRLRQTPEDLGLESESLWLPGMKGKKLFAWWIPARGSDICVVILHGWGSSATQLLPLAVPFHQAGFNVLLFDTHNHGHSDSYGISSMPRFAADLHQVLRWVKSEKAEAAKRLVLVGHSVGAGAVLLEGSRRDDCDAIISLAAFAHPRILMTRYLRGMHLPQFMINGILAYIQWVIGHRFDDIAPVTTITLTTCPVLLVHGDADTTVPVSDARQIYQAGDKRRCKLLLVEDAGHDSIDKIEAHGHQLVDFLLHALADDPQN